MVKHEAIEASDDDINDNDDWLNDVSASDEDDEDSKETRRN